MTRINGFDDTDGVENRLVYDTRPCISLRRNEIALCNRPDPGGQDSGTELGADLLAIRVP